MTGILSLYLGDSTLVNPDEWNWLEQRAAPQKSSRKTAAFWYQDISGVWVDDWILGQFGIGLDNLFNILLDFKKPSCDISHSCSGVDKIIQLDSTGRQ